MTTEDKQEKYDQAYLRMAAEWGKLSYCKRKQVGAIVVKDRMIISDGYNGTPSGLKISVKMRQATLSGMYFMQRPTHCLK